MSGTYVEMASEQYQGSPNKETWDAELWMDNDEGIYNRVREMAARAKENNAEDFDGEDYLNLDHDGAKDELAQCLEQMWDEFADVDDHFSEPEMMIYWAATVYPMVRDVGSLWRVDWEFIADNILSES